MDGHIKKLAVTPAKFDEDGGVKTHEFATLTLELPMDSTEQCQKITELLGIMDKEWVKVEVEARQPRML